MRHALSNSLPALAKRGAPTIGVLDFPNLRRDRRRVLVVFPTYLYRYCYAPPYRADSDSDIIQYHLLSNFINARFFPTFSFLAYFRHTVRRLGGVALEPHEKLTVSVFVLNDDLRLLSTSIMCGEAPRKNAATVK